MTRFEKSGSMRVAVLAPLAFVALTGGPAVALVPTCLQACGLPRKPRVDCCAISECLQDPCNTYKLCKMAARDQFNECISADNNPECAPGPPGRCTIIYRGCVRPCERILENSLKRCGKEAFPRLSPNNPGLSCSTGTCVISSPRERRLAIKACNSCPLTVTPTTTTTSTQASTTITSTTVATASTHTTTSTSIPPPANDNRCVNDCIRRIPSMNDCYKSCENKCEGSVHAERICKLACRNFGCLAIRARCTGDGSNGKADPRYVACCENSGDCIDRADAPCEVIVTTTTTSTTSIATTTVVTSTSTSTSPQPL